MRTKMTRTNNFRGVITALITPFKNGKIDFVSLRRLVRHQLENGIAGFVINGTTAESPNISEQEAQKIFQFVKKIVEQRVPLILGTGSNSTSATIARTKKAVTWQADAALVVVPYYNKPPQRGLIAHFQTVAKAAPKAKIILYNVPGRTVVNMTAETVVELSKTKNIVGIKEASGNVAMVPAIRAQAKKQFLLTSGDDATCIDFMLAGGEGVISVVSHVIPGELVRLTERARSGDESSRREYEKYSNLVQLMGIESNPIPVKMALYMLGLIDSPELRLPLVTLSRESKDELQNEMTRLSLLPGVK